MTDLARKILTGLSVLLLVAFGALLLLGLLVPLYTDEIGSRLMLTRTLVEGGRLVTVVPQCKSTWALHIPPGWYPAAVYYHVFFLPLGLLGQRLSGIILAFAWFIAVGCAIARSTKDPSARLRRLASFVALHAVATVPLTLVTARAEPTLIIIIGAYIALPLGWSLSSRRTRLGRVLVAIAFVMLTSIFYYSHFKSLLFTPFVLVSMFYTFTWRRPAWLVPVGVLVTMIVLQSHDRAKRFNECDEAPRVMEVVRGLNLDPGLARRDPARLVRSGLSNIKGRSIDTAEMMLLTPPHDWLPPRPPKEQLPYVIACADAVSRVWIVGLIIIIPLSAVVIAVRTYRRMRARRPMVLVLTLLTCLAGHMALANHWNFYSSPLVIGVLAIAGLVVAFVASFNLSARLRKRSRPFLVVIMFVVQLVALASMIATALVIGPRLVRVAQIEGTVLPDQPAYVPALGFAAERTKIRSHAANACGIEGDGARRLVIDDATIFAFDGLREPLHLIYVTDAAMWGLDVPGEKDVELLRSLDARGIISRCSYFPTALVAKAKRKDGYCCVGTGDLSSPP